MQAAKAAREQEADLGHDYDGIEPGTPEHEASYDEYLTEAEAEAADRLIDAGAVGIVDVTVEPEAEPGAEAEPEPEAEP